MNNLSCVSYEQVKLTSAEPEGANHFISLLCVKSESLYESLRVVRGFNYNVNECYPVIVYISIEMRDEGVEDGVRLKETWQDLYT